MLRAMLDSFSVIYAEIRALGRALLDLVAWLVKTCSGRSRNHPHDEVSTGTGSASISNDREPGPLSIDEYSDDSILSAVAAEKAMVNGAVATGAALKYKSYTQSVDMPYGKKDEITIYTNPDTPYEYTTALFSSKDIREEEHGHYMRAVRSIDKEFAIIADNTAILKRTMVPTVSIEQIRKDKPTWEAHLSTKEQYKSLRRPIIDSSQPFDNSKDTVQKLRLYNEYQLHKNSIAPKEPGARNNAGNKFVEKQVDLYRGSLNGDTIKYDLEPNARFTVPSKPITEGSDKRTPYRLRSATYQRQEFVYHRTFQAAPFSPPPFIISADSAGLFSGYTRDIESLKKIFRKDFCWRQVTLPCHSRHRGTSFEMDIVHKTFEDPEDILKAQALCRTPYRYRDFRRYNEVLLAYGFQDIKGVAMYLPLYSAGSCKITTIIIDTIRAIDSEKARLGCAVPTIIYMVGEDKERIYSLTPEATQRLISLDRKSLHHECRKIDAIINQKSNEGQIGYGLREKLWVPDPVLEDSETTSAMAEERWIMPSMQIS